jgi:hypothetical protein
MRYELSDFEWTAIKPMLPNKTRGAALPDMTSSQPTILAFVKLASIRIWLRAHESTP